MTITITGLVSTLDIESMISSLVSAAGGTLSALNSRRSTMDSRRSHYQSLASKVGTLRSSIEAMNTPDNLRALTSSSTNSAISVSTQGTAVAGSYSVQVNKLAASSLEVSSGFASQTDQNTFPTGDLAITVGSTTTTVNVNSANSSLNDVVSAINSQVAGVTAYVMNTGDATNPYRLVVSGNNTGTANAVSIDTSGLTGTVPTFTETSTAQDAEITLNGTTVTSSDNSVDGAIAGATLTLTDTTTSAATITIGQDVSAIEDKVQTMVDAWNSVVADISSQSLYEPDQNIIGAFYSESVPRDMLRQIGAITGKSFSAGSLTSLGQLGITLSQTGQLEFDTSKFEDAFAANSDDASTLLSGETTGFVNQLASVIDRFADDNSDGMLYDRADSLQTVIDGLDKRMTNEQTKIDSYESRLRSQFAKMEQIESTFNAASEAIKALLPQSNSDSNN